MHTHREKNEEVSREREREREGERERVRQTDRQTTIYDITEFAHLRESFIDGLHE